MKVPRFLSLGSHLLSIQAWKSLLVFINMTELGFLGIDRVLISGFLLAVKLWGGFNEGATMSDISLRLGFLADSDRSFAFF